MKLIPLKRNLRITLLILLLTAFFSGTMLAQPSGFNKVYYTYKGEKGVVAFRVPGVVMKLAASIADLDRDERQLLRSIRSVAIITIEDNERYPSVNFVDEIRTDRWNEGYKLLLEMHDGDEDVVIAAREKKGKIRGLLVVVGGEDNVMVHIRGRLNYNLLENLADVTGIEDLKVTSEIGDEI